MRKIIAAFRVSLDGFIQGPNGEAHWVDTWDDLFDLIPQVDTCLLGGGMYPGYEQYWTAILTDPNGVLPFTGKVPSKNEITYSKFAAETPHIVLSGTLKNVAWKTGRIVRDVEDIRKMKGQSGKDIYAVGGPTLVSNLINVGLIDELRLAVHPIILGGGKALFKDITERHLLKLIEAKPFKSDLVKLIYTP
ncbi:dihydrofolate reductase family protein [bacterium]|nr:dihydrofolate reductase family protein [bacterium]